MLAQHPPGSKSLNSLLTATVTLHVATCVSELLRYLVRYAAYAKLRCAELAELDQRRAAATQRTAALTGIDMEAAEPVSAATVRFALPAVSVEAPVVVPGAGACASAGAMPGAIPGAMKGGVPSLMGRSSLHRGLDAAFGGPPASQMLGSKGGICDRAPCSIFAHLAAVTLQVYVMQLTATWRPIPTHILRFSA